MRQLFPILFSHIKLGLLIILIVSCTSKEPGLQDIEIVDHVALSLSEVAEVAFGPDGRMWRLIPGREHMFLDVSNNRGQTFSHVLEVNNVPQEIMARRDDRPSIQVDRQGRIILLYFARGPQPWSTFISFSDDGGHSFSEPTLISDQAVKNLHYLDVMRTNNLDNTYIFWLDQRDDHANASWQTSLYQTDFNDPGRMSFPNRKVADNLSPCGRVAFDFDSQGRPIVFARMRFEDETLDHGLISYKNGQWQSSRVTHDNWQPDYCPPLNPGFMIGQGQRYHFTWAATYDREGRHVYYAWSDDRGKSLHHKLVIGDPKLLPEAASVISNGGRIVLAWMETDGAHHYIRLKESQDNGESWSQTETVLHTPQGATDIPRLIKYRNQIYLSWNSEYLGHKIIEIHDPG